MALTCEQEKRIDEIMSRLRASSGPRWKLTNDCDEWLVASLGTDGEDDLDYYVTTDGVHASELRGGAREDGDLIAHAPGDLTYLLTVIEDLRSEVFNLERDVVLAREAEFERSL